MVSKVAGQAVKTLKKYPNRRIYDTSTSGFIKLEDVRQMVLQHVPFKVVDSKSGRDLTSQTLLQIITEQESEGQQSLLTSKVLEELVRFYGNPTASLLRPYFEQQIMALLGEHDRIQERYRKLMTEPAQAMQDLQAQYKQFIDSLTPK